jgi:heme-degrading monooxygenase HmoA
VYLRMLRLQTKPGHSVELRRFYDEHVLPVLETTEGCLFAHLLQQSHYAEEFVSMTIWESPEAAAAYERGPYRRLIKQTASLPMELAEWRVKLTDDPEETGELNLVEPPKATYRVAAEEGSQHEASAARLHVRIVAAHVRHDRVEEFQRTYRDQVAPALRCLNGCREVMLVQGYRQPDRFLSLSLWDREEDAVRYELSGEFDRLTEVLKETLSERYTWQIHLAPSAGTPMGGDTLAVQGYHVVSGKKQ